MLHFGLQNNTLTKFTLNPFFSNVLVFIAFVVKNVLGRETKYFLHLN